MATEVQQTQTTETKRGIFSRTSEAQDTEYKRPIFSNLSFEDTSTVSVQKHYVSETERLSVESSRKVDMLTIDKAIEQHPEAPVKVRLNAHGRILISVIAICICALVAFMIGNAVTISSLSASVNAKTQVVAEQQALVNSLQEEYDIVSGQTLEKAHEMGLVNGLEGATEINSVPEITRPTAQIETNWFDDLCNFFSRLFG